MFKDIPRILAQRYVFKGLEESSWKIVMSAAWWGNDADPGDFGNSCLCFLRLGLQIRDFTLSIVRIIKTWSRLPIRIDCPHERHGRAPLPGGGFQPCRLTWRWTTYGATAPRPTSST